MPLPAPRVRVPEPALPTPYVTVSFVLNPRPRDAPVLLSLTMVIGPLLYAQKAYVSSQIPVFWIVKTALCVLVFCGQLTASPWGVTETEKSAGSGGSGQI